MPYKDYGGVHQDPDNPYDVSFYDDKDKVLIKVPNPSGWKFKDSTPAQIRQNIESFNQRRHGTPGSVFEGGSLIKGGQELKEVAGLVSGAGPVTDMINPDSGIFRPTDESDNELMTRKALRSLPGGESINRFINSSKGPQGESINFPGLPIERFIDPFLRTPYEGSKEVEAQRANPNKYGIGEQIVSNLKVNPVTSPLMTVGVPLVKSVKEHWNKNELLSAVADPASLLVDVGTIGRIATATRATRNIVRASPRASIVEGAAKMRAQGITDDAIIAEMQRLHPEKSVDAVRNTINSERAIDFEALNNLTESLSKKRVNDPVSPVAAPANMNPQDQVNYFIRAREEIKNIADSELAAKRAIASGAQLGLDETQALEFFLDTKDAKGLRATLGDITTHPRRLTSGEVVAETQKPLANFPAGVRARTIQDVARSHGADDEFLQAVLPNKALEADSPTLAFENYPGKNAGIKSTEPQLRKQFEEYLGSHIVEGNPDSYNRFYRAVDEGRIKLPKQFTDFMDIERLKLRDAGGDIGKIIEGQGGHTTEQYFPRRFKKPPVNTESGPGYRVGTTATGARERLSRHGINADELMENPIDAAVKHVSGLRQQANDLNLLRNLEQHGMVRSEPWEGGVEDTAGVLAKRGRYVDKKVYDDLVSHMLATGRKVTVGRDAKYVKKFTDTLDDIYGTSRQLKLGGGIPGLALNSVTEGIGSLRAVLGNKSPFASLFDTLTPGRSEKFTDEIYRKSPKTFEGLAGTGLLRSHEFTSTSRGVPAAHIKYRDSPINAGLADFREVFTNSEGRITKNPLTAMTNLLGKTLGKPTNKVLSAWLAEEAIPQIDKLVESGMSLQKAQTTVFKDVGRLFGGKGTPYGSNTLMKVAQIGLNAPQWTLSGATKWTKNRLKKLPYAYGIGDIIQRASTMDAEHPLGRGMYSNTYDKQLSAEIGKDERGRKSYLDPLGPAYGIVRDAANGLIGGIGEPLKKGENRAVKIGSDLFKSIVANKLPSVSEAALKTFDAIRGTKANYDRKLNTAQIAAKYGIGAYMPAWASGILAMFDKSDQGGFVPGAARAGEFPLSIEKKKARKQVKNWFDEKRESID
jgi:hypothetical protein